MPGSQAWEQTVGKDGLGEPRSLGSGTAASQNSRICIHPPLPLLYHSGDGRRGQEKGGHGWSPHVRWIHLGPGRHMNGERDLVLHRSWRGLRGIRRLWRSGWGGSWGCRTPSFAVTPYTVRMTTAFLFILITLGGALTKGPRLLINTAAFRRAAPHMLIVHSVTRPLHLLLWLAFPKFNG